jgi:hypothetical protein
MEVTDLNGVDLEGCSSAKLAQLLRDTAPDDLTLGLATDGFRTLTLDCSDGNVGLVLGGPVDSSAVRYGMRGVFVCGTLPNTPAAIAQRKGELVLGDQLLQLNGITTMSMTLQEALNILNKTTVGTAITVAMAPNINLLELYTELLAVELPRGPLGYGFTLMGPTTSAQVERRCPGVLIASHTPTNDNVVRIDRGTQIIHVNGQDTSDLLVDHVKALLQFHTDSVVIGLRGNTRACREYIGDGETPRSVEVSTDYSTCTIAREEGSFGVQFNGARTAEDMAVYGVGVFVAGVKPGSPASRATGLELGWQLIRLNGIDMRLASFDELQAALKSVGPTLTLHLEPNAELAKTYQNLVATVKEPRTRANMRSSIVGRPASASAPSFTSPSPGTPTQLDVVVHISRPSDAGYVALDVGATLVSDSLVVPPAHTYRGHSFFVDAPRACRYGLMFGGPKDEEDAKLRGYGVFISGVRGNSVAASIAEIQIGMQIISMDGQDLSQATFAELRDSLQKAGDSMVLVLRENLKLIGPYRKSNYRGNAMRSTIKRKKVTVDVTLTKPEGGGFGWVHLLLASVTVFK